jgi:hypothetical protein
MAPIRRMIFALSLFAACCLAAPASAQWNAAKSAKWIESGHLDLFIVYNTHFLTEANGDAVWKQTWRQYDKLREQIGKEASPGVKPRTIENHRSLRPKYFSDSRIDFVRKGSGDYPHCLIAEQLVLDSDFSNSLVVAYAFKHHEKRVGRITSLSSLILSHGKVELDSAIFSFIFCDGDFVATSALDSIVIARGSIKISNATNCLLISNRTVDLGGKNIAKNTIQESVAEPLGFVKFFEPAQIGLQAAADDGVVKVLRAAPGKAFHKAGLRAGDAVLAVGAAEVREDAGLRRALLRHVALGESIALRVRRDGKTLDLTVDAIALP